jgi:16S rRNA (uracil1498-N3)-methyltransferase
MIDKLDMEIPAHDLCRFYIEPFKGKSTKAFIKGPDVKHIKNVLRLKPGDKIVLFDGAGLEYEAVIDKVSSVTVEVAITRCFPTKAESSVQIIVAQAFLKDKKMDRLVRQLVELGITRWVPFWAERSIPRPDQNRISKRIQRWEKIASEALKQCRRGVFMKIGPIVSFKEILNLGKPCGLKIAFWENETQPIDSAMLSCPVHGDKIFIMMGPEGGFTHEEIKVARACGFVTATLGPRILRAETATIAACSLMQYLFGDMGKNILTKKDASNS